MAQENDSKEMLSWKDVLAFVIAIFLNLLPLILAFVVIFIFFLLIYFLA